MIRSIATAYPSLAEATRSLVERTKAAYREPAPGTSRVSYLG
jgi:hypothetical protein